VSGRDGLWAGCRDRRPGVADQRRDRLWGLIAAQAGALGAPVSPNDACEAAVAVAGVDGGWLTMMSDPARRVLIHATTHLAAELEELQFTLGEGPGTDAFRSGNPVLVADLAAPDWRGWWPGFTVAAVETGAAALFAFPLAQGAIRVGVLGLYRQRPGSLSPGALADALGCADAALLLLLNSRAGVDDDGDGWAQNGSADDHAQVYQATGMVSAQRGTALEEALALLRAYAFSHDQTLDEVAAAVVSRRLRLDPEESGEPAI
jgi:GAF domain/ANTAR domain